MKHAYLSKSLTTNFTHSAKSLYNNFFQYLIGGHIIRYFCMWTKNDLILLIQLLFSLTRWESSNFILQNRQISILTLTCILMERNCTIANILGRTLFESLKFIIKINNIVFGTHYAFFDPISKMAVSWSTALIIAGWDQCLENKNCVFGIRHKARKSIFLIRRYLSNSKETQQIINVLVLWFVQVTHSSSLLYQLTTESCPQWMYNNKDVTDIQFGITDRLRS